MMAAGGASAAQRRKQLGRSAVAALALLVLALYAPVRTHDFVDYDDDRMVWANQRVLSGLTLPGARWALTATEAGNWHPLTWWSHMLDVSLFGTDAGMHHLVSVALHAANAALLFLLLWKLSGAIGAPLLAAALFAVHPLRVESVAWVAERKDVLSTALWLLTTLAYVRWCRRPSAGWQAATVLLFALGLMAKPMLVTLPFTLLLLDHWPLGRTRGAARATWVRLGLEKAPLFALAAAAAVVTFLAQRSGGAVVSLADVPVARRLGSAVVAYGWYLLKAIWPAGLALPHFAPPGGWPAWQVAASAVFLLGATVVAALAWRRLPVASVGWLWYLGTLVPVIGIVQVGVQAVADRYTYVPQIGIAVIAGWAVAGPGRRRAVAALAGLAATAAFCLATRQQLRYWRDTETIFTRALAVNPGNYIAHNGLGLRRAYQQRWEEAEEHYRKALLSRPGFGLARFNLGVVLVLLERPAEAAREFEVAARTLTAPAEAAEAHVRLARLLPALGREGEIASHLERAAALDPANDAAVFGLGTLRLLDGREEEAVVLLSGIVARSPRNVDARVNLGYALLRLGRAADAAREFASAARLLPEDPRIRCEHGQALRAAGREQDALAEFREALRLRPGYAPALAALAGR